MNAAANEKIASGRFDLITIGDPLLLLDVTKDGPNFHIQQFIDEDHPVKVIALSLEKRPSQTMDVRLEVRFGPLIVQPDEALPPTEKLPVSLANPDPNYAEWYADLPPIKDLLDRSNAQ